MLTTDTPIFFPHFFSLRAWHCAIMALLLSGCDSAESVFVSEVISRPNCESISAGVSPVTFKEVARVRGTELLKFSGADNLALFSVSEGEKTTAGHSLTLASPDALISGSTVIVEIATTAPTKETSAHMTTTPCVIIALQRPSAAVTNLEARTTDGTLIGRSEF